jgi:hypothetical protein
MNIYKGRWGFEFALEKDMGKRGGLKKIEDMNEVLDIDLSPRLVA